MKFFNRKSQNFKAKNKFEERILAKMLHISQISHAI